MENMIKFTCSDFKMGILDTEKAATYAVQDPMILYALEGTFSIQIDEATRILHQNEYITINSGRMLSISVIQSGIVGFLRLIYEKAANYLMLDSHNIACDSFSVTQDSARIGKQVRDILSACIVKDDPTLIISMYYQLLYLIRTNHLQEKADASIIKKTIDNKKQQILDFLNENYKKKITLPELASATYFSVTYLSQYIHKQFGKTFSELVNEIRLEHALSELKAGKQSLIQIALDNGFSNASSFTRNFKKEYGKLPSEYQKAFRDGTLQNEKQSSGLLEAKVRTYAETHQLNSGEEQIDVHEVSSDVTQARILNKFWNIMINACPAKDLLQEKMQQHVKMLAENLGVRYFRIWDLYAPEMMIYDGKEINYFMLDTVIDFLVSIQVHPFLEVGLKPDILLKSTRQVIKKEYRKNPFESSKEFGGFIHSLLRHYAQRYGMKEVSEWIIEYWYDSVHDSLDVYFENFEAVYQNAKNISQSIKVGGPGTSTDSTVDMDTILSQWKRREEKPAFLSFCGYPYKLDNSNFENITDFEQRYVSQYHMQLKLEEITKSAQNNGFWSQEIYVTEWSFTISNRNALNDSHFMGAYIMHCLLEMIGKVSLEGYWLGSDLFSQYYDTKSLLNGGCGLISKDGIYKPSFYAFQFFNRLGSYILSHDEYSVVTASMNDNYNIVCCNYVHPGYQYYREEEQQVSPKHYYLYFDHTRRKFTSRIANVRNGIYRVKQRLLDRDHGSVLDEWENLGKVAELDVRDIEYLRGVCKPHLSISDFPVTNHEIQITCELEPNAIESIHIFYLDDLA